MIAAPRVKSFKAWCTLHATVYFSTLHTTCRVKPTIRGWTKATETCLTPPLFLLFSGQRDFQTPFSPILEQVGSRWMDWVECTHYRWLGLNTYKQKKKNIARETEANWKDVCVCVQCVCVCVRGMLGWPQGSRDLVWFKKTGMGIDTAALSLSSRPPLIAGLLKGRGENMLIDSLAAEKHPPPPPCPSFWGTFRSPIPLLTNGHHWDSTTSANRKDLLPAAHITAPPTLYNASHRTICI